LELNATLSSNVLSSPPTLSMGTGIFLFLRLLYAERVSELFNASPAFMIETKPVEQSSYQEATTKATDTDATSNTNRWKNGAVVFGFVERKLFYSLTNEPTYLIWEFSLLVVSNPVHSRSTPQTTWSGSYWFSTSDTASYCLLFRFSKLNHQPHCRIRTSGMQSPKTSCEDPSETKSTLFTK